MTKDLKSISTRLNRPLKRVFLEITNRCNLACAFCYNPSKSQELSIDSLLNAVRNIHQHYGNSIDISVTGGEPTMHPHFFDLAAELARLGFRWTLSTNGTFISRSLVDAVMDYGCAAIAISIDGGEEAHNQIRKNKTAFQETMNGLAILYEKVDQLQLHVTTTVSKRNIGELSAVAEAIAPFPLVRWRINPVKMPKVDMPHWMDEDTYKSTVGFYLKYKANHARKVKLGERSALTHKYGEYLTDGLDKCNAGATVFGLVANGDIVTCMVNRDQVLGNIHRDGEIIDIWKQADIRFCKNLCHLHWPAQNRADDLNKIDLINTVVTTKTCARAND